MGRDSKNCFNSGVVKFNPNDWIGDRAFQYYIEHSDTTYLDQGALNAVCEGNLEKISNMWNYPKQFLHLVSDVQPKIIHFMAHPKPWHGVYFPCEPSHTAPYVEIVAKWPHLMHYYSKLGIQRKILYRYRSVRDKITVFFSSKRTKRYIESIRKLI